MRKILTSLVMLMTAVLSASAFTMYVSEDYTGKEGETFVFTRSNTSGTLYTVTYEINTPATGTTESTPAMVTIKSIVFEGNLKYTTKDFEFPAFFALEKRSGSPMGYGRVNRISGFEGNTAVETVTLNFYDGLIHYIGVDNDGFKGCTNLKHIYVKSDNTSSRRPTFEYAGSSAFEGTTAFTDTVTLRINSSEDLGRAFENSGITVADVYFTEGLTGIPFMNCPNLTTLIVGGMNKSNYYVVSDCPKLTKIVWTGSTAADIEHTGGPFNYVKGQITSLTIEGSVPARMFEGFTKIMSVSSPSDLCYGKSIKIGARAFAGCTNLISAAVGGDMDQTAFEDCPKLKNLTWRGGFNWESETPSADKSPLRSIGVQLKKITFRGSNTSVPAYICAGMKQLETVFIERVPNGVVGAHAFEGCPKLTEVDFSDEDGNMITTGNTYWIFENAFADCKALTNVYNLPVILTRLEDKVFYNCSSLSECPISQKHKALQYIGSEAFAGSGIQSLVVPASVTSTGSLLANNCPQLEEVFFLPNSTSASSFGGSWANLFAEADNITRSTIKTVYLNHQLTMIPDEMFSDYTGLKCQMAVRPSETNMRDVVLMNNVKTIGTGAFKGCSSLELCFALGSSELAQIYPSAFEDSNVKSSFDYMNNLTHIWNDAFKNCLGITRFGADKSDGSENVLPKLQMIGANAFDGCNNLQSVHLPANLKSLQTDAFANCAIETVIYGITSYQYADPLGNAGIDKSAIKTFEIADNVTAIPSYLADGAPLKMLVIGYNVKSVGAEAFADCAGLEEVFINSNLENMPTQWLQMNPEIAPFVRSAVRKVAFGPAATVAGRCILAGTTNLKELALNKVATFNEYSFSNTGLETVTFNNAAEIKSNAFSNNTALKTINIAGTAPTTLATTAFDGCDIYVINTTCESYGAVAPDKKWQAVCSNIVNKDEHSFDYPDMDDFFFKGQGKMKIVSPLDCAGKFTVEAEAYTDYSFISWNDGNKENPRTVDMNEYALSSIYPIFDNQSLYTEEIRLTIKPDNAGAVKVYNEDTKEEVTVGKYKRDGHFVFVPQQPSNTNWYEFVRWEYDESKMATLYDADDAQYPNGLSVGILFTPAGMEESEIAEFPEDLTAVFAPKDILVEFRSCTDGHGTIKIEGEQKLGSEVTITAIPDKGYAFDHWGNDNNATAKSVKIALTLDKIMKAGANPDDPGTPVLDPNTKTLLPYEESALYYVEMCANFIDYANRKVTITATSEHGTVEGAGVYKAGEEVTLAFYADAHYHFDRWSDGNTENPRVFTATDDLNLTAICAGDLYAITTEAKPAEGGTVKGAGEWEYGTKVVLTAEAKDGYKFVGWEDDATAPANREVEVKGAVHYVALFQLIKDGIEDVETDGLHSKKVIVDGVLYIIKGDKVFNALGAEVK